MPRTVVSPLGVAVVGLGRWGSIVAQTLAHVPNTTIVALCDLDLERAQATAAAVGPQTAHAALLSRVEEVLALRSVKAVIIATPPDTHAALGMAALAAGKHAFVEKPMALGVPEAEALARSAHRGQLTLMVGHILNYHLAIERVEELVRAQAFGQLSAIACQRFAPRLQRADAWWSLAPHDLSLCRRFFGGDATDTSIYRRSTGPRHWLGPQQEAVSFLRFSRSRWARLHVSHCPTRDRLSRLVLFGSSQTLILNDATGGAELRLGPAVPPRRLASAAASWNASLPPSLEDPVSRLVTVFGDRRKDSPVDTPLGRELCHFVSCVQHGTRPLTDAREGVAVVSALASVERSETAPRKPAA